MSTLYGNSAFVLGIANILFSLLAVIGNSFVVVAIWKNVSLRTLSYILLAGLAGTDFATGLITQPLYAADKLANATGEMQRVVTTARRTCSQYVTIVTEGTITVMAVERWLHMSRRSLITVRRAYKIYALHRYTC